MSTDDVSGDVARLMAGRTVDQLSDSELDTLINLLPDDGSAVDVTDPTASPRAAARATPGTCTAQTHGVHLRTSSNKNSVGAKPWSECSNKAKSMTLTVVFSKKTALGWRQQGKAQTGSAWNTTKYTYTGAEVACTNTKATSWKAVNTHVIVDAWGCKHTLYSSTPTASLNCGT